MKLKEYIEALQTMANERPALLNFAVKFRTVHGNESPDFFHTEGRTLHFSEAWALKVLNPGDKDHKAVAKKVKKVPVTYSKPVPKKRKDPMIKDEG